MEDDDDLFGSLPKKRRTISSDEEGTPSKKFSTPKKAKYTFDDLMAEKDAEEKSTEQIINEEIQKYASEKTSSKKSNQLSPDQVPEFRRVRDGDNTNYFPFSSVFVDWPMELPHISLERVDVKATQPFSKSSPHILIQSLIHEGSEDIEERIIEGGWMSTLRFVNFPLSILHELFLQMCYSKHPRTSISAFRTLETYFTGDDPILPSVIGSFYRPMKNLLSAEENLASNHWVPTYVEILEVLQNYGAAFSTSSMNIRNSNTNSNSYEYIKVESTPTSSPKPDFPLSNIVLLLEFLQLCISKRPENYKPEEIQNLIHITLYLLLDPNINLQTSVQTSSMNNIVTAITTVESLLIALCDYFDEERWKELKNIISDQFIHSFSSKSELQGESLVQILSNIPVSNHRCRELQSILGYKGCFLLLDQKLSLTNYSQLYSKSLNDEEIKFQILSEILNAHLKHLPSHEEYLFIVIIVHLLEKFINDRLSIQKYSKYIQSIVSSLKVTNKKIREVHGYNLELSKAKDALIHLSNYLAYLLDKRQIKQSKLNM